MMGQYQDAVVTFEQCVRLAPDDLNTQMELGMAYAKAGNKDSAMAIYRKLQAVNSQNAQELYRVINEPPANNSLAQARKYLDQKEYANAIAAYKQATAQQPSSSAYAGLGFAYYQLGQYQNALAPFEQAERLKPDDYSGHYWVRVTRYQLRQYPGALTELQEAIRLNPNDSYNYHWLGEVYFNGFKQYDKAVSAYQECRRRNPGDARNHNELGLAYNSLKQYQSALGEFQEAVRLKPDEALYQSNLGIAYLRLHNTDARNRFPQSLGNSTPKWRTISISKSSLSCTSNSMQRTSRRNRNLITRQPRLSRHAQADSPPPAPKPCTATGRRVYECQGVD